MHQNGSKCLKNSYSRVDKTSIIEIVLKNMFLKKEDFLA
jgi:hypothetical protein